MGQLSTKTTIYDHVTYIILKGIQYDGKNSRLKKSEKIFLLLVFFLYLFSKMVPRTFCNLWNTVDIELLESLGTKNTGEWFKQAI